MKGLILGNKLLSTQQHARIIARDLRKNQTKAELIFWEKVRNKQFFGFKFLRQHPIFYKYNANVRFFVADFFVMKKISN